MRAGLTAQVVKSIVWPTDFDDMRNLLAGGHERDHIHVSPNGSKYLHAIDQSEN